MNDPQTPSTIDLIRWSFTPDPAHRAAIRDYLLDLGAEVLQQGDRFIVLWDDPNEDLDEVVGELWDIQGTPFEITHEEFRRLSLSVYDEEDGDAREVA